ncbi:MAG: DUF427 domain-containing protein [FCB group bacterium]|nr:DUF427 domain-containing protein [FCB group bacterium]
MKAIWNHQVLAESADTIIVEGNHYFPPESINRAYFQSSDSQTACPWKGLASYYSIVVDGQENTDAAWTYRNPSAPAQKIKNYVAFWKGVQIQP